MATPPLRAVLFDLDGTLLDRRETFRRHVTGQVTRHPELFGTADVEDAVDRLMELDGNGYMDRALFFRHVEEHFGLPDGSARVLTDDFEARFPESCAPMPGMETTLATLDGRGLRLGLVTNGRVVIQGRKIDGLGLRDRLDPIVISEAVGVRKPEPAIFAHALAALALGPEEVAFVGDNPEADVAGAKAAGLRAVWMRDAFWPEPPEADHIIAGLGELPGALDGERAGDGVASVG